MAAEVSLLAAGLPGSVVVSVFSTALGANTGFVIPRTIPATALLFSEPDITLPGTSISRRSSSEASQTSCIRPIIPLGKVVNTITSTVQTLPLWLIRSLAPPLLRPKLDTVIDRFTGIYSGITEMVSMYKAAAVDKARLSYLIPILRRPFEPILEHFRCKLGISEDPYMEAPPCDPTICSSSEVEEREITMTKPIPSMVLMNISVETIDDCFGDMTKLVYGSRVLIKSVDDESCEDPRFSDMCQELLKDDKVIMEDSCQSPRYEPIQNIAYMNKLDTINISFHNI